MPLRDYQRYAVDSIYHYFEAGNDGNPVIAMPTGTGKSHVISDFIYELFQKWPTQRVMMLTHVKELIEQNASKLTSVWPFAPLGIFSAGLKSKQSNYPITFAGIQSCRNAAALFGHIDIVVIDECHLVSPNDNTSYQKFIKELKEINPQIKVIGLSATPYRLGLGMITEGGIFTDICCDMTGMDAFNWFIDEGYLVPLIPRPMATELDLTGVKKRGGEYVEKDLQKAVDKAEITDAAIREAIEAAQGRERILVFATGVDHAEHIADALETYGESAACVHSKRTSAQNDKAYQDHRAGDVRWLVGMGKFTTGYDDPLVDCIVVLRPTNSPGLWVQLLGRGTRPPYVLPQWGAGYDLSTTQGRLQAIADGPKQNCLVLDFAGNTLMCGPVNDPVIPKKKGKATGEPPIKFCTEDNTVPGSWDREWDEPCGFYNHPTAKRCCNCNAEFIFRPKITQTASNQELIKRKKDDPPQVEVFDVNKVVYMVHKKPGGYDSMKVIYHCGMRQFTEWVPAWHASNVKHKGKKWWEERATIDLPDSAEEGVALSDELATPKRIRVWVNKKYPEVMGYEFW